MYVGDKTGGSGSREYEDIINIAFQSCLVKLNSIRFFNHPTTTLFKHDRRRINGREWQAACTSSQWGRQHAKPQVA